MKTSTADRRPVLLLRKSAFVTAVVVTAVAILNLVPDIRDPTEGTRSMSVVNDSQAAVQLGLCEDYTCVHLSDGVTTVAPGEAWLQNAQPYSRLRLLVSDGPQDIGRCHALSVGAVIKPEYKLSSLSLCD